jgi:hypothetical protein
VPFQNKRTFQNERALSNKRVFSQVETSNAALKGPLFHQNMRKDGAFWGFRLHPSEWMPEVPRLH